MIICVYIAYVYVCMYLYDQSFITRELAFKAVCYSVVQRIDEHQGEE